MGAPLTNTWPGLCACMRAGEAVFEVLSTYRDADEPLPDPAMLPSPRFVLREPSSRLAIELARKLHDKGQSVSQSVRRPVV
jgi:hypothetical protein